MIANQIAIALALLVLAYQLVQMLRFPGVLPAQLENKLPGFFARNLWRVLENFGISLLVYGTGIYALCGWMESIGEPRPLWLLVVLGYLAVRMAAAHAFLWCRRCVLVMEG